MSLYETEEPLVPLSTAPTPPRSWQAMLVTWAELMATLAAIVGEKAPMLDVDGLAAVLDRLHLLTWTWMWSLPPCSMARKAAFELGRAAVLIERWSAATEGGKCEVCGGWIDDAGYDTDGCGCLPCSDCGKKKTMYFPHVCSDMTLSQRAEQALRIVARQLRDVGDDFASLALGREPPAIPSHMRVYELKGSRRLRMLNDEHDLPAASDLTRRIMEDLFRVREADTLLASYEAGVLLATSTLPTDDQWTMTSEDAARFGRMVVEENGP